MAPPAFGALLGNKVFSFFFFFPSANFFGSLFVWSRNGPPNFPYVFPPTISRCKGVWVIPRFNLDFRVCGLPSGGDTVFSLSMSCDLFFRFGTGFFPLQMGGRDLSPPLRKIRFFLFHFTFQGRTPPPTSDPVIDFLPPPRI